ncbi:hypothetical protein TNCV_2082721 [Trichonephila clavipes]|nr:hypothetical protein TNCV_2082721 [Trichonephila clavipes]
MSTRWVLCGTKTLAHQLIEAIPATRSRATQQNEKTHFRQVQPPGQPIGVNDHFTKHPTREQPLSSQSCQKT